MRTFKKLLFVALGLVMFAGSEVHAQKYVKYRNSQARLAEPVMGVYIKPLIAELKIDEAKGKIKDVWNFTNDEVNSLKGEVENLRKRALFMSTEKHDVDVIVAASFDISSNDNGEGYTVTVIGYPAKYVNWRTATPQDNDWIRNEKISPNNEKEQVQAISK